MAKDEGGLVWSGAQVMERFDVTGLTFLCSPLLPRLELLCLCWSAKAENGTQRRIVEALEAVLGLAWDSVFRTRFSRRLKRSVGREIQEKHHAKS